MRHRLASAAASAALVACLGACGGDSDDASGVAEVKSVALPDAADSQNPYTFTRVLYEDYLEAAEQMGMRPDLMRPQAGFSSGLSALCQTTPAEMAQMRADQLSHTAEAETYSAAQLMADEVALRLGLACPQRMPDWIATNPGESDGTDGASDGEADQGEVSAEQLAEATAEEQADVDAEAAASAEPDTGYGETAYDGAESTPADAEASVDSDGSATID